MSAPQILFSRSGTRWHLDSDASRDDPRSARIVDLGGRRSRRLDEAPGLADALENCQQLEGLRWHVSLLYWPNRLAQLIIALLFSSCWVVNSGGCQLAL